MTSDSGSEVGERVSRIAVQNARIADHARRVLAASEVGRGELALEFEQSVASSAQLHVEGRNFYPPMLADIASASSSVHINQFGFRPGLVGDRFAAALIAKAQDGVPVRLIVDRQGSDPERGSREFYERLTRGGDSGVRDPRDTAARATGAARRGRGDRLEPERARAHRPSQGRRRRRPDRVGRRSRDRGSFRERRVPRPVRSRRRPGRRAAAARVRRQPALARRRDPGGQRPGAVPAARRGAEPRRRGRAPQRAGPVQADHGPRSPSSSTERRTRSTS